MKKSFAVAVSASLAMAVSAQHVEKSQVKNINSSELQHHQLIQQEDGNFYQFPGNNSDYEVNNQSRENGLRGVNSAWINYAGAYQKEHPNVKQILWSGDALTADSITRYTYKTKDKKDTAVANREHGFAQVVDLNSPLFYTQWKHSVDLETDYEIILDSMLIVTEYFRFEKDIVDTLRLRFVTGDKLKTTGYFPKLQAEFKDTVFFKRLYYHLDKDSIRGYSKEIKIPLDDAFYADSSRSGEQRRHKVKVKADWVIPGAAKGIFALEVAFVPGKTISLSDTAFVNTNSLEIWGSELAGKDTYPVYKRDDFNASYVLTSNAKYNLSAWGGQYIPFYAFGKGYGKESLAAYFKISQDEIYSGVSDNSDIQSSKVYPNPAHDRTNIVYDLEKSGDVNLTVTDVTGRVIHSRSYQNVEQGEQKIELDTREFKEGQYFYTLTAGGTSTTHPIMVVK